MAARALGLIVGLVLSVVAPAHAQDYPAKPVTIIVPTGPGGGMEMVARLLAPKLEQRLGKPFIIENRPGAGTNIGGAAVARSAPDGYTLLMATSSTMAINPSIYKTLPFDPLNDLMPVVLYARVPFVLVVNRTSPSQTADDLVRLAKEKPRTLSFGTSGIGTASHLFAELFKMQTGIDVMHVPYKSMLQPLNDVLGGHLDYMFSDLGPALPLVRDGKLRALGVTSATRVPSAAEIPTLAEAGVPGYEAVAWLMVAARAGTPPDVLNKLHTEMKAILAQPDVSEQIARFGMIPQDSPSPEELHRFVAAETVRWSKIVKQAGAAGIE
ncbi:MAG: tripartite tricarboxylate transporter substrate binding protein [Hyphomicrobiales bacterium]|nr:tripartite tricarboxylate transporter substrate binding protein [Alphaproteobacteria bacterium]